MVKKSSVETVQLARPRIGASSIRGAPSIETSTIHVQVYKELRTAIMSGSFAPGQAITIRDLAEGFRVSPMPIRDALGRLVAEKALEMPNSRSFRVPRMTYQQYIELCDFRALVEGYAMERSYAFLDEEGIQRIEDFNEEFADALKKKDYAGSLVKALRFMFSLYSPGVSDAIIMSHIEKLWLRSGPLLPIRQHRMFSLPDGAAKQVEIHRSIISSLRKADVTAAVRTLSDDLKDNYRVFLRESDFPQEP